MNDINPSIFFLPLNALFPPTSLPIYFRASSCLVFPYTNLLILYPTGFLSAKPLLFLLLTSQRAFYCLGKAPQLGASSCTSENQACGRFFPNGLIPLLHFLAFCTCFFPFVLFASKGWQVKVFLSTVWGLSPCELFHFKGFDHDLHVQTLVQPVHTQLVTWSLSWHLPSEKTRLEARSHFSLVEQTWARQ